MTAKTPVRRRNLDGYGAPPIEWDRVLGRLDEGFTQVPETAGPMRHTTWLATVSPDGSPHVMPLGAIWLDGAFYFTAGAGTRKAKNIAREPRCSLTIATHDFDLVVKGEAVRVTDEPTLQRLARAYAEQGWRPTVRDGSFYADYSAPSAGPPPWDLYVLTPTTIYALGTAEPYGATRWDFR